MSGTTLRSVQQTIVNALISVYGEDESAAISFHLMEDLLGDDRMAVQSGSREITDEDYRKVLDAVQRLQNHEPLQYVTGKAHFYNLEFKVNRHVLIPRPETEELVQLILKSHEDGISIMDIGTGSGCIPIALKKNRPQATVYAIDISGEALEVALENAERNGTHIHLMKFDILDEAMHHTLPSGLDVIVSNPPYITGREKKDMHSNVLEYEPHIALFVPDDAPLLFYSLIIQFANVHLRKGGALYFEINAAYGNNIKSHMESYGFSSVQIIKDMQGKDRMVKGILA